MHRFKKYSDIIKTPIDKRLFYKELYEFKVISPDSPNGYVTKYARVNPLDGTKAFPMNMIHPMGTRRIKTLDPKKVSAYSIKKATLNFNEFIKLISNNELTVFVSSSDNSVSYKEDFLKLIEPFPDVYREVFDLYLLRLLQFNRSSDEGEVVENIVSIENYDLFGFVSKRPNMSISSPANLVLSQEHDSKLDIMIHGLNTSLNSIPTSILTRKVKVLDKEVTGLYNIEIVADEISEAYKLNDNNEDLLNLYYRLMNLMDVTCKSNVGIQFSEYEELKNYADGCFNSVIHDNFKGNLLSRYSSIDNEKLLTELTDKLKGMISYYSSEVKLNNVSKQLVIDIDLLNFVESSYL